MWLCVDLPQTDTWTICPCQWPPPSRCRWPGPERTRPLSPRSRQAGRPCSCSCPSDPRERRKCWRTLAWSTCCLSGSDHKMAPCSHCCSVWRLPGGCIVRWHILSVCESGTHTPHECRRWWYCLWHYRTAAGGRGSLGSGTPCRHPRKLSPYWTKSGK